MGNNKNEFKAGSRSHKGQAQSWPRKRARQRENAQRLAQEAAKLGITPDRLKQQKAVESLRLVWDHDAYVARLAREARSRSYGRSYY